jgi:cyclase
MLRPRIIPTLLLRNESLVKTVRFRDFTYIGDPANTVRIFNELEVDELFILDISASLENRSPNLRVLADIANECFMPLGYGGGINSLDDAKSIFDIGFEKIVLNTYAERNPKLIEQIAGYYGCQAVVISIDIKKNFFNKKYVRTFSGRNNTYRDPLSWVIEVEKMGAGEILFTSIDHEGTWTGFDFDMVKLLADNVSIPVIAHGGAGTIAHIQKALYESHASAVAVGSMVVFQKQGRGVLVNFPEADKLTKVLI